jgi:uncharacterized heparinase superfamily protein
VPKLWLYNLHYFEHSDQELIRAWIAENPQGKGTGWEPYPLSLRVVNWIKWALQGGVLDQRALESLLAQVSVLYRRLEYHLLANHLLANAKALVFAGCFFSGPVAEAWLERGIRILGRELHEQILGDGGHFERSPMYHSVILEDLLDLMNLRAAYGQLVPDWRGTASRMLGWLENMIHPDGRISLFNDATFGVAPEPRCLFEYAARLAIPVDQVPLGDSGYIRLTAGDTVAIFDAGPLGPDYQPGHGHADTLSFELSRGDKRVIVDSGTSTYYPASMERLRQRGTAAHNTIKVDGFDQSEVWDVFRVGHRARILEAKTDYRTWAEAAHDGYARTRPRLIHRRRLELTERSLYITDWLEGVGRHKAQTRFQLHPDADAEIILDPAFNARRESGTYHPGFNISVPNQVITGSWVGECPAVFRTTLVLDRPSKTRVC